MSAIWTRSQTLAGRLAGVEVELQLIERDWGVWRGWWGTIRNADRGDDERRRLRRLWRVGEAVVVELADGQRMEIVPGADQWPLLYWRGRGAPPAATSPDQ